MEDILFRISASEWAEIVRNYTLAGAASVTAVVAWKGLTSWKNQQTWDLDRKIARELLIEKHHIEKAAVQLRVASSMFDPFDLHSPTKIFSQSEINEIKTFSEMLKEDIDKFDNSRSKFSSKLAEAHLVLCDKIKQPAKDLELALSELRLAADARRYITSDPETIGNRNADHIKLSQGRSLSLSFTDDQFRMLLSGRFDEIEKFIKPFLGRPT